MSPQRQQLIADARAAGYEVRHDEAEGTTRIVVRRHRGTGAILQGVAIYHDGTAIDLTVDLGVARGMKSYKIIRRHLDLADSPERVAGKKSGAELDAEIAEALSRKRP